ncbi:MAG: orotate phosphoribosyltransferase [Gammaproteobacteria bacterium]|nr:orotate phosphoribosyltransferase [Gammaproteobacteria bacterium]
MQDFQKEFIEFAIAEDVLRFGDFTLKSGRQSPYFFNSGLFDTGTSLLRLGRFYVNAIEQSGPPFDMLFGPAYKGIPLASAVAVVFAAERKRRVPYSFNRKEAKDHGEGGLLLGAPLAGRVLIIDDVITAGTSVNEAVSLIRTADALPAGVVVCLDRQERGQAGRSALEEVEQRHGIPVISIVTLAHLIEYLEQRQDAGDRLRAIREYRDRYGVAARGP